MDRYLACFGLKNLALDTDNIADIELFKRFIRILSYTVTGNIGLNIAL